MCALLAQAEGRGDSECCPVCLKSPTIAGLTFPRHHNVPKQRDKEGDEGSGRRKKKDRKRKESRKHKEGKKEKKGKEDKGVWAGGASHEALVKLLAAHPGVVEELVLVLRALEAGACVCVAVKLKERWLGFVWRVS